MSVEYKGIIVVGYDHTVAQQIAEDLGLEKVDELSFDSYACSYDGGYEDSIFGERIESSGTYSYNTIDLEDLDNTAKVLSDEYEDSFGVRPKVYLMTQGY